MDQKHELKTFYASKPDPGLTSREGKIEYGDTIESGLENLTLPAPEWERKAGRETETILAKNFPVHVASRVESSIKDEGFYGATPDVVLSWYAGVAEGVGLADSRTAGRLNKLSDGLAGAEDKRAYFRSEVQPFLTSMCPARR